jgi:hypothetical protein
MMRPFEITLLTGGSGVAGIESLRLGNSKEPSLSRTTLSESFPVVFQRLRRRLFDDPSSLSARIADITAGKSNMLILASELNAPGLRANPSIAMGLYHVCKVLMEQKTVAGVDLVEVYLQKRALCRLGEIKEVLKEVFKCGFVEMRRTFLIQLIYEKHQVYFDSKLAERRAPQQPPPPNPQPLPQPMIEEEKEEVVQPAEVEEEGGDPADDFLREGDEPAIEVPIALAVVVAELQAARQEARELDRDQIARGGRIRVPAVPKEHRVGKYSRLA